MIISLRCLLLFVKILSTVFFKYNVRYMTAQNKKTVTIIKGNGETEPFSRAKLMRSLKRSGASTAIAEHVTSSIEGELKDGMHTQKIYRKAFQLLRKKETLSPVAHKYNLRNATMELGPDGFAFEQFVGEIFKSLGHKVKVGVYIEGWCVEHEVDVSGRKDGVHRMIECKFHNRRGYKTDLKVALYVNERFRDIEKKHEHDSPEGSREHEGWLVTNTKLTSKAIQYAQCAGLKVVGWGYPKKGEGNLEDMIELSGIHPVTILMTLSNKHKKLLLEKDIVTCAQVRNKPDVLKQVGVPDSKIAAIMKEVNKLYQCGQ